MMEKLISFDLSKLLSDEKEIQENILLLLSSRDELKFVNIIMNFYLIGQEELTKRIPQNEYDISIDKLFGLCSHSFMQATSLNLKAQFNSASIFKRKTTEALQAAMFIKSQPDSSKLWCTNQKEIYEKFNNQKKSWFKINKDGFNKKYKTLAWAYNYGSEIGAHANFEGSLSSHRFSVKETYSTSLNFFELGMTDHAEESKQIRLNFLINSLCHFECLSWWFEEIIFDQRNTHEILKLFNYEYREFIKHKDNQKTELNFE